AVSSRLARLAIAQDLALSRAKIVKPVSAVLGSKPEAKAAAKRLTAQQRDEAGKKLRAALGQPQRHLKPRLSVQAPTSTVRRRASAADLGATPLPLSIRAIEAQSPDTSDSDGAGLPNHFERRLSNAFSPAYFLSADERDVFATFKDQSVLEIAS